MALLPLLFLVTIAAATWAFRGQPARFRWTLFGGAAVATWGAVLGLLAATPTSTALSVWQPAPLFRSRLEFVLDDPGWTMAFVMATNLLVSSAFMASRTSAPVEAPATFILGLSAVAMAGVMAGNLASLIASWALFDLILLARSLSSAGASGKGSGGGFAIFSGLLGLMLVLSATATLEDAGASDAAGTISVPPIGFALLVAAALLRMGGGPHPSGSLAEPGKSHLDDPFPRMVSAALGASLLVRTIAGGIPPDMVRPMQWVVCALGLTCSVRWVLGWRDEGSARYFLTGLLAFGAIASTFSASDGERPALAAATLALCAAPLVIYRRIHHGAHRVAPAATALIVAGLPATIGGTLMSSLVSSFAGPLDLVFAAACVLGLGLLAGGLLQQAYQPSEAWPASEALPKGLFTLGKFVPLLAILGLGLRPSATPTAMGGGALVLALVVAVLVGRGTDRGTSTVPARWRRLSAWLEPSGGLNVARGVTAAILRAIHGLASVLEGEGAMLWVLVLLMVIVLGWR